ncbi:MAG: UvrD-helicase domain-containing protein [Gemmataceae bacterium]|nr:UvrD-helicase domain-containing protein [Gemmataceae bacterium]
MSDATFPHLLIHASAGSGKTHQLTNRYLALLASGVEPETILATTFTRKAAGEILDRVLWRLAEAAGDDAAAGELARQARVQLRSRQDFIVLLRRMVQSLHRVRVGTLDSFYVSLAGSFGLELGLPPGWSICEEADDDALRRQAVENMLEREDAAALVRLYRRLTRGETKRSVDGELLDIVDKLYAVHQETSDDAWRKIHVGPALSRECLEELVARIEAFDLSEHSGMEAPRADDLERLRAERWEDLVSNGLCVKAFTGENAFRNKPIPDALVALYTELIDHVRSVVIEPIAEQTRATRDFLCGFQAELWALKQTAGGLRFDEVTHALARALSSAALKADMLAFRLDGAVEHLLLDEFQDTSLAQWRVLEPLAQAIMHGPRRTAIKGPGRSFFCVGDVKQAIYRWRGGMAEIFLGLPRFLEDLEESPLDESRRSAPPIIEVVNTVFAGAARYQAGDKAQPGLQAWGKRFALHSTVRTSIPGYVVLRAGPAQLADQGIPEQRGRHIGHVAQHIKNLCTAAPGRSIGVLCRTNDTIARMIFELRRLEIEASEEGGNPLTDSPAVEVILSLFTLADHPGHSIAWHHLKNSPLAERLRPFNEPDHLARHIRREILADGIGKVTQAWIGSLIPACNRRDLSRLQQLIEMAYDFQSRSTLRADDFVGWVRRQRVPDPSSAGVRVMTIHSAKGLQFDAVVLPELDCELIGRVKPSFVVDRDPESLDVSFVCRYANETVQKLLTPEERGAFELDRGQRVEESLSMLYVVMTRAIHALYMFVPGPRQKKQSDVWCNMLVQALAPAVEFPAENTVLFERGEPEWHARSARPTSVASVSVSRGRPIAFRAAASERRRGLEHAAPSKQEGGACVPTARLFHPSEGTGMAAGTLYHAWFETIEWLDDGEPSEAALRKAAAVLRWDLPAETWRDLDRLLAQFQAWLRQPALRAVLSRTTYTDTRRAGFPEKLKPLLSKALVPQQVERERRFVVRQGNTFWDGSFDRVVWLADGQRTVAADVIDFKTDLLPPGDDSALAVRTDHYRPQLEAYRRAVTGLSGLPAERVAARLVFPFAGKVVEV